MSTIRDLMIEGEYNSKTLAEDAKVSVTSIRKMLRGEPIRTDTAGKILAAMSKKLGRSIQASNIDDLLTY